jgi:hypothetical protein
VEKLPYLPDAMPIEAIGDTGAASNEYCFDLMNFPQSFPLKRWDTFGDRPSSERDRVTIAESRSYGTEARLFGGAV